MRLGLFALSQRQQPFAEFHEASGCWRIWLAFNPTVTSGTFYELTATGSVDRVTVKDNDVVEIVTIVTLEKMK